VGNTVLATVKADTLVHFIGQYKVFELVALVNRNKELKRACCWWVLSVNTNDSSIL